MEDGFVSLMNSQLHVSQCSVVIEMTAYGLDNQDLISCRTGIFLFVTFRLAVGPTELFHRVHSGSSVKHRCLPSLFEMLEAFY